MDNAENWPRGTFDAPLRLRTLLVDANENGQHLAVIEGALWPPIGSPIELPNPLPRDGIVRDVRLQIDNHEKATVLIDVEILDRLIDRPQPAATPFARRIRQRLHRG